jgi:thiosulfate reductase cytochrome b subunit
MARGPVIAGAHPWIVRVTHWLNAVVVGIMIASGLEIFAAFPSFGQKIPETRLLEIPRYFRLGGWLGGALQWHLAFMWPFMATGVVYLCYSLATRRGNATADLYNPIQKRAYTLVILTAAVSVVTGWMLYKPVQLAPLVEWSGGFPVVRFLHFAATCVLLAFIPGHVVMVAIHGRKALRSML